MPNDAVHNTLSAENLTEAIERVPAGKWAVAVSGGADSVCLLSVLNQRAVHRGDLSLHVAHLDHQLRGTESDADAAYVRHLSDTLVLPVTIGKRDEIERELAHLPANASARYRAGRFALFAKVVSLHQLDGVILAHHAGDQTETVVQRLLRGAGPMRLGGISMNTHVGSLRVLRPLLHISPSQLREQLRNQTIPWREDTSNTSPEYQRNRIRTWLARHPQVVDKLLPLAHHSRTLQNWVRRVAVDLTEQFDVAQLRDSPKMLAEESARRWLIARGTPLADMTPAVVDQLMTMACDAASPSQMHFPGRLLVRRRRGAIWIDAKS